MENANDISGFEMKPIRHEIEQFAIKISMLMDSIESITDDIIGKNDEYELEYLKKKQIQTGIELFKNFILVASKSMSKQIDNADAFRKHYENFFFQSDNFNEAIVKEQNRINNLNSETLKKRATESIQHQIDNFYSIYDISMKI
ncbi:MAG TPA: hypothetical protein DCO83_05930 [Mucilaginibacter sp.]|jgi:uncharacterized protein with gpF-like domain|nr:hypothetical protein [Mucilaginibacter sp.]